MGKFKFSDETLEHIFFLSFYLSQSIFVYANMHLRK